VPLLTIRRAVALLALACTAGSAVPRETGAVSPAEQKVAEARRGVAANPGNAQPYTDLALALARRARETSDPDFYRQAEAALDESRRLAPDNLDAEKVRIWVLLGRHEFAPALEAARALNRKVPDDVLVYGFIVDAAAELGRYDEAEAAAQWMLDLRPGNVPGFTRAAYLRELFGDIGGALELMRAAYQRIPPLEVEDRAWTLAQIGHLLLLEGKPDDAQRALEEALRLFPGYHYALGNLAKVKRAHGKFEDAVALERERYRSAPHPENLFALARALRNAGYKAEARTAFADFEKQARAEMNMADNANRELIFYYADYAGRSADALAVAKLEIDKRRDVHTLDAYAWALYVNGRFTEAHKQIRAALDVGIRDPGIFYHAGMIARALRDPAASSHFEQALSLSPRSEFAPLARKALAGLTSTRAAPRTARNAP
jgi:tetratricopeptide (TPR) repeat protein